LRALPRGVVITRFRFGVHHAEAADEVDCNLTPFYPKRVVLGGIHEIEFGAQNECYVVSGNGTITYTDVGECGQIRGPDQITYFDLSDTCVSAADSNGPTFAEVTSYHKCAVGQTHVWRTRANGHCIYKGVTFDFPQEETPGIKITC
jgi:hypothetical protein